MKKNAVNGQMRSGFILTRTKTVEVIAESVCKACHHIASEHESFYKRHGPKSLPQTIYWNCSKCTCRIFK